MSHQSLYRKWRPKKFSDVAGQDHIRQTLQAALRQNSVSHAYIFSGSRGTGKTTTARLLAKALNCQNFDQAKLEPCNECASCLEFNTGRSLDLIEIDAASNTSVEQARDLVEKINFAPISAKYKVFVIDEVHMLSRAAFDALLKTLEEPPAHAIFIFATTEIHRVPDTILSRCQRFEFKKPNLEQIKTRLMMIAKAEKMKIDEEALELLAELGDGSFRDAESLLEQVYSFVQDQIKVADIEKILGLVSSQQIEKMIKALFQNQLKTCFQIINKLANAGYDLGDFARRLIEKLRLLLVEKIKHQNESFEFSPDQELNLLIQKISLLKLIEMIRLFSESRALIKSEVLSQLPLELAVVKIIGEKPSQFELSDSSPQQPVSDKKPLPKIIKNKSETTPDNEPIQNQAIQDLAGLKQIWPQFLQEIKSQNHSLFALFKDTFPISMADDQIILATKYKFYQEKLMSISSRKIIGETFAKLLGRKVKFDCKISDEDHEKAKSHFSPMQTERKDLINSAKDVFGV